MDIIKYILLAIFVPFILVAILGLVLNVSMAAWKASCKLKPKIIGKLVAIIATTIVAVATRPAHKGVDFPALGRRQPLNPVHTSSAA